MRVGLLGVGRVARRFHLPILAQLEGAKITAIAEGDAQARASCRSLVPSAELFNNYEDLIESASIDAAVICLPPMLHGRAAKACFDRGLHVYVEKPLATNMAEGREVVAAWRKAGTVGQVGFNFRFHPDLVALRQAVNAGEFGKVVALRATFSGATRQIPAWKRQRVTGGGVLLDLASHQFDLVRFLLADDVVGVEAAITSVASEEDTASVQLILRGGPLVSLFLSLSAVEQHTVEVIGTEGSATFDRYRHTGLSSHPARRDFSRGGRVRTAVEQCLSLPSAVKRTLMPHPEPSFRCALGTFFAAVSRENCTYPDLMDGLMSLSLIAAAEEAARTGERTVPERVLEDAA